MHIRDVLFILTLTFVPAFMAWRAYRVGYQQGCKEERKRQARRVRYSNRANSRQDRQARGTDQYEV